jgi:hypothetical protein
LFWVDEECTSLAKRYSESKYVKHKELHSSEIIFEEEEEEEEKRLLSLLLLRFAFRLSLDFRVDSTSLSKTCVLTLFLSLALVKIVSSLASIYE